MNLVETIQNPKIASGVASATAMTGMGTAFDWIPSDIGKLASLVGVLLSITIAYFSIRKLRLEIAAIEIEREEKREAARQRREAGLPTRRCDDDDCQGT